MWPINTGKIFVTLQTPGAPEIGYVRSGFIKKSQPIGNLSPEYPVTVS